MVFEMVGLSTEINTPFGTSLRRCMASNALIRLGIQAKTDSIVTVLISNLFPPIRTYEFKGTTHLSRIGSFGLRDFSEAQHIDLDTVDISVPGRRDSFYSISNPIVVDHWLRLSLSFEVKNEKLLVCCAGHFAESSKLR